MSKGRVDLPPLPYVGRAAITDSEKLDLILKEIEGMKKEIKEVKITIENETNQSIKVIAEGHMILDRKLKENKGKGAMHCIDSFNIFWQDFICRQMNYAWI